MDIFCTFRGLKVNREPVILLTKNICFNEYFPMFNKGDNIYIPELQDLNTFDIGISISKRIQTSDGNYIFDINYEQKS